MLRRFLASRNKKNWECLVKHYVILLRASMTKREKLISVRLSFVGGLRSIPFIPLRLFTSGALADINVSPVANENGRCTVCGDYSVDEKFDNFFT